MRYHFLENIKEMWNHRLASISERGLVPRKTSQGPEDDSARRREEQRVAAIGKTLARTAWRTRRRLESAPYLYNVNYERGSGRTKNASQPIPEFWRESL